MVFITFLFLSMRIQNIYGIILFIVKSDVFSTFHFFQVRVQCQFSWKIKYVQTDWGDEYHKLNSFFQTISIHHHLICPHLHEQNDTVKRHH